MINVNKQLSQRREDFYPRIARREMIIKVVSLI